MLERYHYAPCLRLKAAELQALGELEEYKKDKLLPILMPCSDSFLWEKGIVNARSTEQRNKRIEFLINRRINDLASRWNGRPFLLDVSWLNYWRIYFPSGYGMSDMQNLYLHAIRSMGLSAVPVTSFATDVLLYKETMANIAIDLNGLGLRLYRTDFEKSRLANDIDVFLNTYNIVPHEIDLIIDLGDYVVDPLPPTLTVAQVLHRLPNLMKWRSLILLGGAFPENLIKMAPGHNVLPRLDWQYWAGQTEPGCGLERVPTFGDYGPEHAYYSPPHPPE